MMKNIKLIAYLFIAICTLNSCTDEVEPMDTNYVTFESDSYSFGVDIDGESTNTIKSYASTISATARTLEVVVISEETSADEASYTVPTSFVIPGNSNVGELSVTISDLNIGSDGKTLTIALVSKEGLYVGNNITLNISRLCPSGTKSLELSIDNTDGYPDEASFSLVNSAGETVLSLAAGELTGDIMFKQCLPLGEYTLNVEDSYGDGGTTYTVSSDGVGIASISGASYSSNSTITFTL
ncbi:MAG: hypothetical protein ACJA17_000063 [Polaribacter sp.]|jgi:hypothetical protein